jgi:hypothetical protein
VVTAAVDLGRNVMEAFPARTRSLVTAPDVALISCEEKDELCVNTLLKLFNRLTLFDSCPL